MPFTRTIQFGIAILLTSSLGIVAADQAVAEERQPLNVLLFTADDLNWDSLGCYGCSLPNISPHLDTFASQGLRFHRAHVNVAICQPSRGVLATGRYSHRSGITGFNQTRLPIPTVMESLREHGYLTGILGKVGHSTPKANYRWDFAHDQPDLGQGRDPQKYYQYSQEFLNRCRQEGKPFYLMVNSHDPHRPFYDPDKPPYGKDEVVPTQLYQAMQAVVPGFLPDLDGVREELSHYFNSVKRLDDTFGAVMKALAESGFEQDTLVMFLSDNGMAFPFAKCNCYLNSTKTPWLVRWPGVVRPGAVDDRHFISGIDFFPTVMEAAGFPLPEGLDGTSFLPLLKGDTQANREWVYTQIDRKAGGAFVPMRCVQDGKFGYIFNPWSDGQRIYRNNNEGQTMRAMVQEGRTNEAVQRRVNLFRQRELEEFFDLENDPGALNNLAADPAYAEQIARFRARMAEWMKRTGDPTLAALEGRDSPEALKAFMDKPPAIGAAAP